MIFYISITWLVIIFIIIFHYEDNITIKNIQIKNIGFVIGELSKQSQDCKFINDMIHEYKESKK